MTSKRFSNFCYYIVFNVNPSKTIPIFGIVFFCFIDENLKSNEVIVKKSKLQSVFIIS